MVGGLGQSLGLGAAAGFTGVSLHAGGGTGGLLGHNACIIAVVCTLGLAAQSTGVLVGSIIDLGPAAIAVVVGFRNGFGFGAITGLAGIGLHTGGSTGGLLGDGTGVPAVAGGF